MKCLNKILFGLGILFLVAWLSSCSIAVKAVYNQFSDEDEFILFKGEKEAKTADQNPDKEVEGKKSQKINREWEEDLVDNL